MTALLEIESIGEIANRCGFCVARTLTAARELNIRPMVSIDHVPHFSSEDAERIEKYLDDIRTNGEQKP